MFRSPRFTLLLLLSLIILLTLFSPEEKSLGANVRVVYLHGAWVLAAELAFVTAALAGLIGLALGWLRKPLPAGQAHRWSAALGRTGLLFWIAYLPLSLLAMQTNWNGLFLAEPRFRLALIFAVAGLLIQVGLGLFNWPWLTSLANIVFIVTLRLVFARAAYVMHPPPSPIFSSGNWVIIAFFIGLNGLTLLAAWQVARLWLRR